MFIHVIYPPVGFVEGVDDPLLKTKTVFDELCPQWNETFAVDLGDIYRKLSTWPVLYFEVWDNNNLASNVFLGCCHAAPEVYLGQKHLQLKLKASPKLTAKQNKTVGGELSIGFEVADGNHLRRSFVQGMKSSLELTILSARIIGMSKSPYLMYVVVKASGLILGSSKASSLRNSHWENERFTIDLPHLLSTKGRKISVELCLKNTKTRESHFLAEIEIDVAEALHPMKEPQTRNLTCTLGHSSESFAVIVVYQARLITELERLSLQAVNYDSQMMSGAASTIHDAVEIHPITEGDGYRGKRRLQRYQEDVYQKSSFYPQEQYDHIIHTCRSRAESSLKVYPAEMVILSIPGTEDCGRLNLILRLPTGKLSEKMRDFARRISASVAERIKTINDRIERANRLKSLASLVGGIGSRVSDVKSLMSAYLDAIASSTGCSAEAYLLGGSNRSTFTRICSSTAPDEGTADSLSETLILQLLTLAKLRLQIQLYHGDVHVRSLDWSSASQVNMRSLMSLAKRIDAIIGEDYCVNVITALRSGVSGGCFVAPLVAEDEIFYGILVLRGFDDVPAVTYRIDTRFSPLDRRSKVFSAPEDGYACALQEASPIIARSIMETKFSNAYSNIRDFPVDSDTTCAEIVKHVFQQIFISCPAVRGLTLWRAYSFITSEMDSDRIIPLSSGILVGSFADSEATKRYHSRFPGDLRILHHKNRWTLSLPWLVELPDDKARVDAVKEFLNCLNDDVPKLPASAMLLCLEEVQRCATITSENPYKVHLGNLCITLGQRESSIEAYIRLFELPFKVSNRIVFMNMFMTFSCRCPV